MGKFKLPLDQILWLLKHAGAIAKFIESVRHINFKDGVDPEDLTALVDAHTLLTSELDPPVVA